MLVLVLAGVARLESRGAKSADSHQEECARWPVARQPAEPEARRGEARRLTPDGQQTCSAQWAAMHAMNVLVKLLASYERVYVASSKQLAASSAHSHNAHSALV